MRHPFALGLSLGAIAVALAELGGAAAGYLLHRRNQRPA